jgi:hypothetical protein
MKGKVMRLSLDPVKDAELIVANLEKVVPETAADTVLLVRQLLVKFDGQGVNRADVVSALRQVASEAEGNVVAALAAPPASVPPPAAPAAPAAPAVYAGPEAVVDPPGMFPAVADPAPAAETAPVPEPYAGPEAVVDPA